MTNPVDISASIIIPEPYLESDIRMESKDAIPLPRGLERKTGNLLKDLTHTWYEYLPTSYTGKEAVPLVVSLHGGSTPGHEQARKTGWHLAAERDGFIVIFPNSTANKDVKDQKNAWDNQIDGTDMKFLKALFDYVISEYNIDTSRIYMHGVSNGDMMSLQFAARYGNMLAGLASSIGPTPWSYYEKGEAVKPSNPLPVYQWRGEQDLIVPKIQRQENADPAIRDELNAFNKKFWLDVNGNEVIPEIRIRGKDNLEIYRGGSALVLYNEVKDAPHQTEIYAADAMWRELLSGYSRGINGEIVADKPLDTPVGDKNAVAIVLGSNKAFIDNQVFPLDQGGPVFIDNCMYVPIQFLHQAFGAKVELFGDGNQAIVMTEDNNTFGVSNGNAAVTINNRILALDQKVEFKNGMLYIPVQSVSEKLFNKHVSFYNEAVYISDHYAELSRGIARTLMNLLK